MRVRRASVDLELGHHRAAETVAGRHALDRGLDDLFRTRRQHFTGGTAARDGVFALADGPLNLGRFDGRAVMSAADYFHYAAEAYASLGSADITATGDLRLIAAISPLNGILLLAWSGGFLFSLVDDWRVQLKG